MKSGLDDAQVFATLPLAEAFEALHNEQRNALMHTIAAHYAISFGEEGGLTAIRCFYT